MAIARIGNGNTNQRDRLKPMVTKEDVIVKKKSFGTKVRDLLISPDANEIKQYLLTSLVDFTKNSIVNGVEFLLFNQTTSRRNYRTYSRTYEPTPYKSYWYSESQYGGYEPYKRKENPPYRGYSQVKRTDYRDFAVSDYGRAKEIVDTLRERIRDYTWATKADLYDIFDQPTIPEDFNFGWDSPEMIGICDIPGGGYGIDLADAKYIPDNS